MPSLNQYYRAGLRQKRSTCVTKVSTSYERPKKFAFLKALSEVALASFDSALNKGILGRVSESAENQCHGEESENESYKINHSKK
jgi:hypothetical protein